MTRHPVLTSVIPAHAGYGRPLTSTERKRLIALGVSVPVRTRVVRAFGSEYHGALYGPARGGGLTDLGVSVTTR